MQRDLNFYLKWAGTAVLIIGTAINSMGYYPAGPLVLLVGGILWFAVSIRWRESSLIVTNGVMLATAIIGLAWHYFR